MEERSEWILLCTLLSIMYVCQPTARSLARSLALLLLPSTALKHPWLVCRYGSLCIISGVQLFRILYYRHNLKSFHFAFLLVR
jgi:hypothetical protein